MKNLINIKNLSFLSLIFITVLLMSFNWTTANNDDVIIENKVVLPPSCSITAKYITVDVWENAQGRYYIDYSQAIETSGTCNMVYGCPYIDLVPSGGWECSRTEQYFKVTASSSCNYLTVESYLDAPVGGYVEHTIDFRVNNGEGGVESGWGMITLHIHGRSILPSTPGSPCSASTN